MKIFQLHPNIQLRLAVEFLTTLISMTVLPFVAIYFADRIGQTIVGFMLMSVVVSGVCGGFIGGFYSDKMGRKKLMIIADAVTVVMYVCIAFVDSPWWSLPYVAFVFFVIVFFFSGIMGPVAQAMIIDVSDPENRKFIFTLSYWAMNLAIAAGGILGAFLFENYHFELFLGVAGISLVSLLVTVFWISESYRPEKVGAGQESHQEKDSEGVRSMLSSYGNVLKDKIFVVYVIASLLLGTLEEQLTNYIGVRLNEHIPSQVLFSFGSFDFHVDGFKMLGFLQTENTMFVVAFAVGIGMLMKRFSDHWVLYIGIGLFASGYFILGFSLNPWILFMGMGVVSIGEIMFSPVKQAYLADIAPENRRSSYMAVSSLGFYMATMIAAIFVTLGAVLPYWVIAGSFLLMGATSLVLFQRIMSGLNARRDLSNHAFDEKSGGASL
ncbi:MAG TPA: MFS transporter [Bacillales bacterium]|nr:MFS transporter [Bacillales bacterium]